MKGIDICREYYKEFGAPMLETDFAQVSDLVAAGLCGSGSECFFMDDEISRDHDLDPGFCIFIPDEKILDRKTAFRLERSYSRLPKEFMGLTREALDPAGGNRRGIISAAEFFTAKTGHPDASLSVREWLTIDENFLLEATNGEIWHDPSGFFTALRSKISYLPEEIRLKKLSGELLMMFQSGQYNYPRCIRRSDTGGAALSAVEFVKSAIHAVFLLNRRYRPYYKLCFRMMRTLPLLSELSAVLEDIISTPNDPSSSNHKYMLIENTASAIINELKIKQLSDAVCDGLDKHAFSVNEHIREPFIRNLDILCAN